MLVKNRYQMKVQRCSELLAAARGMQGPFWSAWYMETLALAQAEANCVFRKYSAEWPNNAMNDVTYKDVSLYYWDLSDDSLGEATKEELVEWLNLSLERWPNTGIPAYDLCNYPGATRHLFRADSAGKVGALDEHETSWIFSGCVFATVSPSNALLSLCRLVFATSNSDKATVFDALRAMAGEEHAALEAYLALCNDEPVKALSCS